MGIFSKKGVPFSDNWDTSVPPTFDGNDVYATDVYGSTSYVATIPGCDEIARVDWLNDSHGSRIIVTCRGFSSKSYVVYQNTVQTISI